MSTDDIWAYEGPNAPLLTAALGEPLQVMPQNYSGFGQSLDGSSWRASGRRLADGSWFEIHWWYPPFRRPDPDQNVPEPSPDAA